ncbi:acetate kinase [Sulfitobacter sp. JL08]|uniref:acetate/propionate family kinase n=1 Tax=Sulfitobacter sp. JL08 TaxID=2070369 RepID=UPI000E0B4FD9|nr:acetate/propionate family kinase [Sulfitobacter sp. JL08]AXI53690.1 acetate kinase [Sulfitobacter sp. JL08]
MTQDVVITFNAGSSSLRCGVFRLTGADPEPVGTFGIRGIPDRMVLTRRDMQAGTQDETTLPAPQSPERAHPEALGHMIERLDGIAGTYTIRAFAHRIVHGGADYAHPVRIDDDVMTHLKALEPLAPSHQPHNLRPIRRMRDHYPDVPQIACFDTAFHRTQPRLAQLFALPRALGDAGILRYGFHGLSYDYIAHRLERDYPDLARGRVIVAHLGHGVSLCALKDGQSIATTMGLTALDGMPMGQRCGTIDPGVVLHLIMDRGYSASEVRDMLYEESGLMGVSDISGEMNDLLASDDLHAAEAIDYFTYHFTRNVGALQATLGGVDAIVLTGGMGKYIPALRARLVDALAWMGIALDRDANAAGGPVLTTQDSRFPVLMLPTDEELILARGAAGILDKG